MTQDIIEKSRTIAEFMGYEYGFPHKWDGYGMQTVKGFRIISKINHNRGDFDNSHENDWAFEDLQFHTSYDWLMPVVEKIESLGFEVVITKGMCHIFPDGSKEDIEFANKSNTNSIDKIALVFETVYEFIAWYNNQSK